MRRRKSEIKENVDVFDYTEIYQKEILPKIDEIKKVCVKNKIPFLISCAPKNTQTDTTYYNDGILTGSMNINLYDDRFERYLLVINGARLAPIGDQIEDEAQIFLDSMSAQILGDEDLEDLLPRDEEEMEEVGHVSELIGNNIEYVGDIF